MNEPHNPETLQCCLCGRGLSAERRLQHEGRDYCLVCAGAAIKEEENRRRGFSRIPVLAAVLSLLPGVGQMYNRQLTKGVVLLIIFFALCGFSGRQSEFGIFIPVLIIWSMFDAYWGARRINEVGEASPSEIEVRWESATTPAWGGLLIVLGVLFLLNNFGVTWLTYDRLWPAALLLVGLWLLYTFAISRKPALGLQANLRESDHG